MEGSAKDYAMLHFVVLIWGFTAILGVLISVPAVEIVFYRTLMASTAIGLIFLIKKTKIGLPPDQVIKIVATGFIIAIHWILFFWAARAATVSVALAGFATCTLWTAFLEPIANKTKLKWYEILLGLVVISGLYVIFRFEFGYWVGLTMAITSAFLGALFTVINAKLIKRHSPFILTFYEMVGACMFTVLFFPVYSRFLTTEGQGLQLKLEGYDWLWLLILAGVCTVYAFSVSVELMKRLTAFAVNLTVNLEPVYGIILAVLIFGEQEKMTAGFYIGTLIILLAVCIYPIISYFYRRKKAKQLLRMQ
ncbi:DMT family transporter [Anditalea andensis]|uniref:Membrane protein n=1 Tax=Anditalea andensis TaxID=1048983 RepID=A0A074KYR8_9BACT|nr:DMT family transporter [Anditalea andensis]KEO72768.1 membrane protein [Anditalea andensis]